MVMKTTTTTTTPMMMVIVYSAVDVKYVTSAYRP